MLQTVCKHIPLKQTCETILIFSDVDLTPSLCVPLHDQQVPQLLLVHLHVGHMQTEPPGFLPLPHAVEHFLERAWNDSSLRMVQGGGGTSATQCVSLTRSRLTIRKDSAVDTIDKRLDEWRHCLQIHFFLEQARERNRGWTTDAENKENPNYRHQETWLTIKTVYWSLLTKPTCKPYLHYLPNTVVKPLYNGQFSTWQSALYSEMSFAHRYINTYLYAYVIGAL